MISTWSNASDEARTDEAAAEEDGTWSGWMTTTAVGAGVGEEEEEEEEGTSGGGGLTAMRFLRCRLEKEMLTK